MEKKLEIKKLADVVVWADSKIRDGGYNEEKYNNDGATAYCHVKANELWRIRDVALETMERQTVYTNALNKDIADKAAKIELLEKEIEGRKEGYTALKELMDTEYIPIDEHDNVCKDYEKKVAELEKELADCKVKIRHQKENLDGINKTLEIRTKENESLIAVKNNQDREIEAHEAENARLSEKITSMNDTITELSHEIDNYKDWNAGLRRDLNYWKEAFETQATSLAEVRKLNDELVDTLNKSSDEVEKLEKQVEYLKKELDQTCTCKELDLKGHNRREMALVNELADKNDEIKKLKEENSYLKSEIKQKQNIIKKAYDRYSDEVIKTRKDLMEVAYRDIEKDNGYVGFKLYVKSALIEAKGDKNEANEIITEAVRSAYTEWDKTQKENEKTIKKAIKEVMNKKYGYAGEIAFHIRSEVDKKRIVDIGEGAEKILGVSRELFDAAIKALVDDGYQEIIGRIPQATNSYVYMDMHVLATPDVETKETANAENIKSLDFDIPCGEDAIE